MIPKTSITKKKTNKIKISEHQIQSAFFKQVSIDPFFKKYRPVIFAVPNGGFRNIFVALKLQREGVTKGVPDVFVDVPSCGYHGLRIEFKTAYNKPTYEQLIFKEMAEKLGYKVVICYSTEDAIDILRKYLQFKSL